MKPPVLAALLAAAPAVLAGEPLRSRVTVEGKVVSRVVADVDADGRPDLVLAVVPRGRGDERALLLFLQREGGRFAAQPDLRLPVKRDVLAWGVGDLDPEPGGEILFVTRGAAFAFFPRSAEYRENLRRLASFESAFEVPDPQALGRWPFLLDLDGDGLEELAVPEGEGVRVFGRDPGRPGEPWPCRAHVPYGKARDEDRSFGPVRYQGGEFALSLSSAGLRRNALRSGFVLFAGRAGTGGDLVEASASVPSPLFADADGDGRADLWLLVGSTLRVHLQAADGSFAGEASSESPLERRQSMRASAVDFDGDGRAEWLTIGPEGESALSGARVVEVWRGGERGPEVDAAAARFKFEGYAAFPEFLDFDGDGRTDLALSTLDVPATPEALARSARIRWTWHLLRSDPSGLLERSPSGRVVEEWAPESYGGGRTAATFAGDFDGDGVADFAAIDPTGVFRAHRLVRGGGGRFEREDRPLFRVSFDRWPRDLEVLRLDEDGRADAVVYHDSGFTALATR